MLNRRSLRIKAIQQAYAFYQCKESNHHLAEDSLRDFFGPNLNSMEVQDKDEQKKNEESAIKLFRAMQKSSNDEAEEASVEVKKVVVDAQNDYRKNVEKDFKFLKRNMISEVDKLHDRYLSLLSLAIDLAHISKDEAERKSEKANIKLLAQYNFSNNSLIEALRSSEELQQEFIKRDVSWKSNHTDIKGWYKNIISKDQLFSEYQEKNKVTFEDDLAILNHVYKNLIFKNEVIRDFLEEQNIHWEEDSVILRSMVSKTLKSVKQEGANIELVRLAVNWEEDREYFNDLFSHTIENDEKYEQLIAEKSKNWDISRLAILDKIIIKMALAEMQHFPSIPVKVSINEYIDISKNYSTPKSKKFINGILDAIAGEMMERGEIRKSGRGLIDNK